MPIEVLFDMVLDELDSCRSYFIQERLRGVPIDELVPELVSYLQDILNGILDD